ncbi:stalk domain-containing protein [Paenibacillus ihumii]|uniref:stalk domain-containing protein n=1 Tax=Paenibacillus ihumii TaxID=687436 RepID=UPI0006D7E2C1|nr:stalk domain-containing protein [Paenibacillus ihumii]
MRRIGKLALAATIWIGTLGGVMAQPQHANASTPIRIMLDGYPLSFPAEPIIKEGTTLVPFRAISEALGIQVTWDAKTKSISAARGTGPSSVRVQLTLNSKTSTVNGSSVDLAVAPQAIGGHTLIPLSFFSQQFGAQVDWDQKTRTVSISSPKQRMYTMGFYAISSFSDAAAIPSLDSVAFGWSRIDENGKFTLSGKDFKWPQAAGNTTPESLVSEAANSRTLPYLMVYSGDVNGELTKIIENADARKEAISEMVATAKSKQFQGLLLDFEGLGLTTDKAKTRSAFTAFVKELSLQTKSENLKLALALHPLNSSYQGYDYKALGQIADELIIMAYDYRSGGSGEPEPADKVDEAIRLALKETKKDKLVLGLNLHSENAKSVNTLIGLAKRYDLKGIAIWRLGLVSSEEWTQMQNSVEFKKTGS